MATELFIGLMSGTSLDGVDAALVEFSAADQDSVANACRVRGTHYLAFDPQLQTDLLQLHVPDTNELELAALTANRLARLYAQGVQQLLQQQRISAADVRAIGCHGQTIRHRPELGFTLQIGNTALLAELAGIDVVSDFRSRDVAAGGQGAPLVPAFHQAVFADAHANRVIVNIGGIANLTYLPADGEAGGFDSGPGNMLMDAWANRHLGKAYDESGNWADSGHVIDTLLAAMLAEDFFSQPPPKSTGRDLFNLPWLEQYLQSGYKPADVQRTLLELTARSIAAAIERHCAAADEAYVCGGGAHNKVLLRRLQQLLPSMTTGLTDALGIQADWVEAAAFAWLAKRTLQRQPSNLPAVTGARGLRILGAIHRH